MQSAPGWMLKVMPNLTELHRETIRPIARQTGPFRNITASNIIYKSELSTSSLNIRNIVTASITIYYCHLLEGMKTNKTPLDFNYSLAAFWLLFHIPVKWIQHVTKFLNIPQTSCSTCHWNHQQGFESLRGQSTGNFNLVYSNDFYITAGIRTFPPGHSPGQFPKHFPRHSPLTTIPQT